MDDVAREIISADMLRDRIAELGSILSENYRDKNPLLVAIMTGAMWFLADLVRAMDIDLDVDFLALNRFHEGGRIRIASDTALPVTGRHVVLVEDLVDTGLSLSVLRALIADREPESVATVTLIDKAVRRLTDVPVEYRGFEAGDEYLIGYGFDHEGRFRNLPGVWVVMDPAGFLDDPDAFAGRVFSQP
ncbi:MAG TPA: phosphoribosyltransferase family protein [Acidimicrobiia bacterium]|jgi:hypoxanthine phosphoribosyltransferase